jgi:hypothetical protein
MSGAPIHLGMVTHITTISIVPPPIFLLVELLLSQRTFERLGQIGGYTLFLLGILQLDLVRIHLFLYFVQSSVAVH